MMAAMDTPTPPSPRTQVRRIAERGHYDRDTIGEIIDAAWHCHIAFIAQESTHCIPTACWREGAYLYVHGSNGSRMLKALLDGQQVCVCITHIDGLVLARSAFHHSINYRSVVIYGRFERVDDEHKLAALDRFVQRVGGGREREIRPPDPTELAATTILRISIEEAAAKLRTGGPKDDDADMSLPVWAGVLPMRTQHGSPERDLACAIEPPDYVRGWAQT
jgi:nitroimidazol reductase NimA-like FMN-containing flavoprotein (pyridoxamine 5'-phosphate oxidase superfamily)